MPVLTHNRQLLTRNNLSGAQSFSVADVATCLADALSSCVAAIKPPPPLLCLFVPEKSPCTFTSVECKLCILHLFTRGCCIVAVVSLVVEHCRDDEDESEAIALVASPEFHRLLAAQLGVSSPSAHVPRGDMTQLLRECFDDRGERRVPQLLSACIGALHAATMDARTQAAASAEALEALQVWAVTQLLCS